MFPFQPFPGHSRHTAGGPAQFIKHIFNVRIVPLQTESCRHLHDDPQILARVTRRVDGLAAPLHTPIGIGEGPVLFREGRGRQDDVGKTCSFGEKDILHHQVIQLRQRGARMVEVGI